MRAFIFALATLSAASVQANDYTDTINFVNTSSTNKRNLLEGVNLTEAAANRTITLTTNQRMATLKIAVFYTYSAATALTATMSCSLDGTNYATPQKRDLSAGTYSDLTDSRAVSGDISPMLFYATGGCEKVKIVFAGTGSPDASDLINVQATAVVGE